MVTESHYRWDFVGLSTDEKPTPATSEKVVDGSTFYCADNSKLYVYCTDNWYERKALEGGGGGDSKAVKELTASDYNYPKNEPDSISFGLLDSGFYKVNSNDTYVFCPTKKNNVKGNLYYVCDEDVNGNKYVYAFIPSGAPEYQTYCVTVFNYNPTSGDIYTQMTKGLLDKAYIADNLTTDNPDKILSAKQGKALKDLTDSLVIKGEGAPASSTAGSVGTLYEDTTNGKLYQCTAVSGDTYTWSEVGAGGGGACNWVVRTLTTDDYNYPTTNPNQLRVWKLPDGDYTLADNVTASYASGYPIDGSSNRRVVIWHGDDYTRMLVFSTSSNTSKKGKFVVTASGGSLFSEMLLSVRNDLNAAESADTITQPLSAYQGAVLNDKITKQGNTLSDTAPSTSTAGVLGQLYTDTTNMHTYQCTAISGSTYTWTQRW